MESTEGTRARRAVPSRAKTTRFGDTAALFEALGGGWWNRKSDVAEAETAKPLNHSKAPQPLFPTMPVENTSPFKGQWGKQCGEDRHWLKLSRHSSASLGLAVMIRMRCLVIEDESITGHYICNGLKEAGHTPTRASRLAAKGL